MQEHTKTVDDGGAALFGLGQKGGFEGVVDQIVHHGAGFERVERHAEFGFAGHAERGGVDDGGSSFEHIGGLNPVINHQLGPEIGAERLGAGARAVGDADFRHADLDQRGDHGAGGTARPKDGGGARGGHPVRGVLAQIGDKARAISVISVDFAILAEDQRVGRPDQGGAVTDDIGDLENGLFVRKGHVQTDEADLGQMAQRGFKVCRGDIHRDVMALDTIATQPEPMQGRGSAVGDGVADDTGEGDFG